MMAESKPTLSEEALARLRTERRYNRRQNQLKNFCLDIAPDKYRGMHFFGNYKNKGHKNTLNDPRITALPHELIVNKTVLDLGAGDASTTIEIAMRLFPKQIVALDIDGELLLMGKRRIDNIVASNERYKAISESEEIQKTLSEFPLYFQEEARKIGERNVIKMKKFLEIVPENLKIEQQFPRNVCFLNDNFFNVDPSLKYDTIICFGTVKWVHLALGDKGIQAFFHKAYDLLKPDGYFVLEYSLIKSYKQKKGMNELFKQNFKDNIKIDPQTFPSLLKFVGFELVSTLNQTKRNFLKHPLQIFRKSSPLDNQEK